MPKPNETEVIPTNLVPPMNPERTGDGTEPLDNIDVARTYLAFLERLDIGDGQKVFHEVEADVERAGRAVFAAFAGDDTERKGLLDTILQSFASEE